MNLLEFRKNVTSQTGEDGVLEKIFEVIGVDEGWCVEFGAWDGKKHSNTFNLITDKGWKAVLIESSPKRFPALQETYRAYPDVVALQRIVGFETPDLLDEILATTPIPIDFDLLVVDIDGNDYHVLAAVEKYRPKVVVIEFNPSVPNHVHLVQKKDLNVQHGSSLRAITTLCSERGYELVCCTGSNGIYVRKELFPLFGVADNSLDALNTDRSFQTWLIQLYDGTFRIAGCQTMIWHGLTIEEDRIQMLPKQLRIKRDG